MFQITLKAARVNAGLLQSDVAQRLNVDNSTIVSWEKGKTSPKMNQLQALCDLYETPIDRIFLTQKSALSELR